MDELLIVIFSTDLVLNDLYFYSVDDSPVASTISKELIFLFFYGLEKTTRGDHSIDCLSRWFFFIPQFHVVVTPSGIFTPSYLSLSFSLALTLFL